ncbi:hypothetical protein FB451DRAFT_1192966 [Mycena latifolia]|nr:hypothetical protein FB451DRAFT_1192966 [Mycena latifolia]
MQWENSVAQTAQQSICNAAHRWNSVYLEHSDLCQLGLHIQLGHDSLKECAVPGTTSFLNVITHCGVKVLCVVYCACNQVPSRETQLIDAGLIPMGEPLWAITSSMLAHLAACKNGSPKRRPGFVDAALQTKNTILDGLQTPDANVQASLGDLGQTAREFHKHQWAPILDDVQETCQESPDRQWAPPLPMLATPTVAAVAAAIAAAENTTDDATLVMNSDKCWDHVLQVCMDGMCESQQRKWLVEIEEQEQLMNGPRLAYLSGKCRRLISEDESEKKKRWEQLAAVKEGAGVGSEDEGWVDYSLDACSECHYFKALRGEGNKYDKNGGKGAGAQDQKRGSGLGSGWMNAAGNSLERIDPEVLVAGPVVLIPKPTEMLGVVWVCSPERYTKIL